MCLIIDKPADVTIEREKLAAAWSNNHDGWGVMWTINGKIHIEKGMKYKDLETLVDLLADTHCVIHVRYATSGKKDMENCHPFRLTDEIWFCHNGITSIAEIDKDHSDTWHLAEYILGPLLRDKPELFGTKALEDIIHSIDSASKFVLMRSDGEVQIINEKAGSHLDGCWLSNTYSLQFNTGLPVKAPKWWQDNRKITYHDYSDWKKLEDEYEDDSYVKLSDGIPQSLDDLMTMEWSDLLGFIQENPYETAELIYNSAYEEELK